MEMSATKIARKGQRGQAMVFSLLFIGAVLLGLTFLYKAGKLTSEKMQLQNAADATAFSVSVIEARDLNFAAYLNRAMVANEVAMGQLIGLVSWANHIISVEEFLQMYATLLDSIPIVGNALAGVLRSVGAVFKTVGGVAKAILRPFAQIGIAFISKVNLAYSIAQTVYHLASTGLLISTVLETISLNAPGAKLSDAGTISLITHIITYHARFAKLTNDARFFAAVVRKGRDQFTRARGWKFAFIADPPGPMGPEDDPNPLGLHLHDDWDVLTVNVGYSFDIEFFMSLDRAGGSELRFTGGKPLAKNFNWSAADVTALNAMLRLAFEAWAEETVTGAKVSVAGEAVARDNRLRLSAELMDIEIFKISVPLPTSAPFSAGTAQAGRTGKNAQTMLSMFSQEPLMTPPGPVPLTAYGGAPRYGTAYDWPALGPPYRVMAENVSQSYPGLPRYVDAGGGSLFGIDAPYFLVALVKEIDKVNENEVRTSGRLRLTDRAADNEVAAIAKSEVYFARPNDLAQFRRSDGYTETGNSFSPFWQARLAETSDIERMVVMALQQKQIWVEGIVAELTLVGDFTRFLNKFGLGL